MCEGDVSCQPGTSLQVSLADSRQDEMTAASNPDLCSVDARQEALVHARSALKDTVESGTSVRK